MKCQHKPKKDFGCDIRNLFLVNDIANLSIKVNYISLRNNSFKSSTLESLGFYFNLPRKTDFCFDPITIRITAKINVW